VDVVDDTPDDMPTDIGHTTKMLTKGKIMSIFRNEKVVGLAPQVRSTCVGVAPGRIQQDMWFKLHPNTSQFHTFSSKFNPSL